MSARQFNYHGTDFARLERSVIVGGYEGMSKERVHWVVRLFCLLFLWNEPQQALRALKKAYPYVAFTLFSSLFYLILYWQRWDPLRGDLDVNGQRLIRGLGPAQHLRGLNS